LLAFELVGHPEQPAEDGGAVVGGEFDNPGFDDETAQFDQMPRALAALDLPCPADLPAPPASTVTARQLHHALGHDLQ
jgi:hypothetical protein